MPVFLLILASQGDAVPLPAYLLEPMLKAKLITECDNCGHLHPNYDPFDGDADKWIEAFDVMFKQIHN